MDELADEWNIGHGSRIARGIIRGAHGGGERKS
jgi:hypothetical protein